MFEREDLEKLFREELEKQLHMMRSAYKKALIRPAATFFEELIRIAHSIKGAAKLVQLDLLSQLSLSLESYLSNNRKRGEEVDEEGLKYVHEYMELLGCFLDEKKAGLTAVIKKNKNRYLSLEKRLQASLSEKEKKSKKSAENREDRVEKKSSLLHKLAPVSALMQEKIASFTENFSDKEKLQELATLAEKVKKLGKQYEMPLINRIGESLAACFLAAYEHNLTWTQGHYDLIFESLSALERFSKVPLKEMSTWLRDNQNSLEPVLEIIEALVKEAQVFGKMKEGKGAYAFASSPKEIEEERGRDFSLKEEDHLIEDKSLLQLFQVELVGNVQKISEELLAVEGEKTNSESYYDMMRAAHSIKGAARIVGLSTLVSVAHTLEDYFQKCYQDSEIITPSQVDVLLQITDSLAEIGNAPIGEISKRVKREKEKYSDLLNSLLNRERKEQAKKKKNTSANFPEVESVNPQKTLFALEEEQFIRVSAENLNRLMGLAGESMVEGNFLFPFLKSLFQLKNQAAELVSKWESLFDSINRELLDEQVLAKSEKIKQEMRTVWKVINKKIEEFEAFAYKQSNITERFYNEVIRTRMRPFSDLAEIFPRFVRDLAKELGKKARLVIRGKATPIDREILERLEAPLSHLLRNSIDHGIEAPEERRRLKKNEEGTIILEAFHKGGSLCLQIADDGRGIDIDLLKKKILEKKLALPDMLEKMSAEEILEFLFLPGFSTVEKVTDVSGRGFGLNVLQEMVQAVGGSIKLEVRNGTFLQLLLPLTLSILPALVVTICGERYAFALMQIQCVVSCRKEEIKQIEDRYFFEHEGENIGIVFAHECLGLAAKKEEKTHLPIVILSNGSQSYGIAVDTFWGQKELVVQKLDSRLGKIPGIYAGALAEDGSPILILDTEDLIHTIDKLLFSEKKASKLSDSENEQKSKSILIVDDSITVRKEQKKLLENFGYKVDTADNGTAAWNALCLHNYDLLITDIDMPHMNGFDLIRLVRSEKKLRTLPIIVVTYKDSEGDKEKGMDVGADIYLTKESFHDATFVAKVRELIEKAEGKRGV